LAYSPDALDALAAELLVLQRTKRAQYVELRTSGVVLGEKLGLRSTNANLVHVMDVSRDPATLFSSLHRSSIQRRILRAAREQLCCVEGRGLELLHSFYRLLLLTRSRHRLLPQPLRWFENLVATLGDALKIRIALLRGQPVAGIVTLEHRETMVYKYGASDATFHHAGAMPFLLWTAIQDAHARGFAKLDFGRSEPAHRGLITFKDRWGAARSVVTTWRSPTPSARGWHGTLGARAVAVLSCLPTRLRVAAGGFLYRHAG
jgi:hypothetical protein